MTDEDPADAVDVFRTDWYRSIKASMGPGDTLWVYRKNRSLSQAQLGTLLGGVPRQHISNMERHAVHIEPPCHSSARHRAARYKESLIRKPAAPS